VSTEYPMPIESVSTELLVIEEYAIVVYSAVVSVPRAPDPEE